MGRRFTAASNDYIHVGTSAGLAGFDYRYGTVAVWCNIVSYPVGFAALLCTNLSVGLCFDFGFEASSLGCWDGNAMNTMGGMPAAGTTVLVGSSKLSGSVALRGHIYVPSTNTFTHGDFTNLTGDSAAVTSLTIGARDAGGADPADVEMFEAAMWPNIVMSDREWERLATCPDWGRFGPGFHKRFTGRDANPVDMATSIGRCRVRQTARGGTTRGPLTPPFGMGGYAPARRR